MTITPAFMTRTATAKRLGISYDTFQKLLPNMRRAGFPEPDPGMNRYVTHDVEAWVASRSKRKASDAVLYENQEVNYDAL